LTLPDNHGMRGPVGLSGGGVRMKGSTLTRADLCEAVHDEVGLSRQDCATLVERTLELMIQALEAGEQVKLSGFGVFQVRAKRARMGRNPKTGEPAAIEPRRVIGFRASQVMKARVDKALAEED
jgi:integration host factor subunit alpha